MTQRMRTYHAERAELHANPSGAAALEHFTRHGLVIEGDPDQAELTALAMLHQSRVQSHDSTDGMLAESAQWLRENKHLTPLRGGSWELTPPTRDAERVKRGMQPLMTRRRIIVGAQR